MVFVSIQKKLSVLTVNFILVTLIVTLALSTLFTVVTAQNLVAQGQNNIREELINKGQILLLNCQISMKRMVEENAFADLNQLIEGTVTSDNDIAYGMFVDRKDHPWSVFVQNEMYTTQEIGSLNSLDSIGLGPSYREIEILGDEIYEFFAPIFSGNEIIGHVRYGFSTKRINHLVKLSEETMYILLFRTFLILILFLTPLVIIELQAARKQAKEITEPLALLTAAAKGIREGNYEDPFEVQCNDEVGILAQDLELMRATLKKHHDKLEKRADDATIQLNSSLKEQLFQANKLVTLGTLVAGTAHEINNPNNSILLAGRTLEQYCKDLLPILDHYADICGDFQMGATHYSDERDRITTTIEQICRNSHRISAIISQLKNYGRKESVEVFSHVNMNSVVNDSIEILSREIQRSTPSFEVTLDPTIPLIHGIYQQLEQVVVNLLQNACQAVNYDNGRVTIETCYKPERTSVFITVSDNGAGMDEKTMNHMFDSFFTRKSDRGGSGLGLYVSQRIITEHSGDIRIKSTLNRGTEATIVLPIEAKGGANELLFTTLN